MTSSFSSRVFLDAAGAAPVHPVALAAWQEASTAAFAEYTRIHSEGRQAAQLLRAARETIASIIGARAEEVFFAPSFAAAALSALGAIAPARRGRGRRIVCSAVERRVVLDAAHAVSPEQVDLVAVDGAGRVKLDHFQTAIDRSDVGLAVLQAANLEVGTTQPLAAAAELAAKSEVPLLVDATGALGRTALGRTALGPWDALLAQPSDWGGPAGIAIFAIRKQVRTRGWDSEAEGRSGFSVPAAVAAAASLHAVTKDSAAHVAQMRTHLDRLRVQIPQLVPDVVLHGCPESHLPHVLTFSCLFVDGEALTTELDKAGFAVGSGSACLAEDGAVSHVLAAMGALTHGNVRLGLHPGVRTADVERFLVELPKAVHRVREQLGTLGL